MKPNLYRKSFCAMIIFCLVLSLFTVCASAASVMRPGYGGRSAEATDSTADENGMVGENTSAPGTGEFGDDTSNSMNDTSDNNMGNSADSGIMDDAGNDSNDTESAIDKAENAVTDAIDGAEDVVENATSGMSVWSIVLVVAIIAAIAVLVFAFFSRRK